MLEIKNLSFKKEKKLIINDLNVKFHSEKITSIVGANGSGKTTLTRILMGLNGYVNFSGEIFFKGESIKELSVYQRAKRGITLAWQEPVRFEGITVSQYLEFSAKQKKLSRQKSVLFQLGLDPDLYLDRVIDNSLSGGERKRVELASILMMEPKVVILDEPDSGIDLDSLRYIDEVFQYLKKQGAIVILITHNLATMEKTDMAYMMCKGKLVKVDSSDQVKKYFYNYCRTCKRQNKFDLNLK